MKKAMIWMAVLTMLVSGAQAVVELQPLSVPEAAAKGATHVAIIKYTDFTESTTNTAQALTNAVTANTGVQCVGMHLEKAFNTANTNYTFSCAMKVGDGSDDDLYMASTELASEGTEVFVKFPPPHTYTVTSASTSSYVSVLTVVAVTTNIAYTASDASLKTNALMSGITVTYQTNSLVNSVTGAATVGQLSQKLYTTAGSIVYTFTPSEFEALDKATAGEVHVYFRLRK